MSEKLQVLKKTHTWDYVDPPSIKRLIGCNQIYMTNTHSDESTKSNKTRLVAKRYTKKYGIDYEETIAFVARMTYVRSLLAISAAKQWSLLHMDVENVFLNGTLS